jgi:tripeptidyl-peptidase-1
VLEKIATAVSDPDSADYQMFLTKNEIQAIVSPPVEVQNAVIARLTAAGVKTADIKNLGDSIDVRASVGVAGELFATKFFEFVSACKKHTIVRSFGEMSMPEEFMGHVEMVVGLSAFPIPHLDAHRHFQESVTTGVVVDKSKFKTRKTAPQDDLSVIPATYFLMYQVPAETFGNDTATSQGVIEFVSQNYAPSDLTSYAQGNNIQLTGPTANTTVGPNDPTNPQVEAQLDVEAMGCVNDEVALWFWLEAGSGWQYAFTTHFIATAPNVPSVISISYAWSENDQCNSGVGGAECQQLGVDTQGYVIRVNTEFQKIAALGISTLSASGDSGANGRTDPSCTDSTLHPDYPACSPWVTSVGATQLTNAVALANQLPICSGQAACAATGTEVAVSFDVASFTSGGGFSWYAPMPSWQKAAVSSYLTTQSANLPPSSYFNASGRAFPDIAAIGHNFLITVGGSVEPVGGTSVAAPVVASLVAMLNQIAIKKTGKTLGFISPLLYKMYAKNPAIFHDITVGDNKCTESGCSAGCQGFVCAAGWYVSCFKCHVCCECVVCVCVVVCMFVFSAWPLPYVHSAVCTDACLVNRVLVLLVTHRDPVTGLGTLNYQAAENYLLKMFDERAARK